MIVNEIAKFWNPLQLRLELLLVAQLSKPLLIAGCDGGRVDVGHARASLSEKGVVNRPYGRRRECTPRFGRKSSADRHDRVQIATGRASRRSDVAWCEVHDGELILIVGALLAAGLLASLLAGACAFPASSCSSGVGMAVGSDGAGWIDFDDYELARRVGIVALALILFEGGLAAGFAGDPAGARPGADASRSSGRSSPR